MKCKRICHRCGCCCSDLQPVTEIEIEVIRDYVQRRGIKDGQSNLMFCPFLRRHSCAIYHVRPQICREYHCKLTHEQFVEVALRKLKEARPRSMRAEIYGITQ